MSTKEEIEGQGDHLAALTQAVAVAGITLSALIPEVAAHCSVDDAKAVHDFVSGPLKEVALSLSGQLESISEQWQSANGEVSQLEEILAMPEAKPQPGTPGYL